MCLWRSIGTCLTLRPSIGRSCLRPAHWRKPETKADCAVKEYMVDEGDVMEFLFNT